jgi:alkaline phosphatase
MTYVDGFVITVKKRDVPAYRKMAVWGRRMWMKHGALGYYECLGDDLKGMPGCGTFKQLAKIKAGETVFFSFIIYRSKSHRHAVNKRVMADMKTTTMPEKMPFNPRRMAYGGFRTIVQG